MKKVWLVWTGGYSDKDVVAVAETEEIAEEIRKIYAKGRYTNPYITEIPFATSDNFKFKKEFLVNKHDGEITIEKVERSGYVDTVLGVELNKVWGWRLDNSIYVYVSAYDDEEAIKKASDLFAQYEAEEFGLYNGGLIFADNNNG